MNLVPGIVVSLYLLVLLVLGWLSFRRGRSDEEDYYVADRKQGWIVTSLTIMATFFSSFALLGAPGKVYTEGVVFALFALNVPLAGACVWVIGEPIRRIGRERGYVTPGDLVAAHYGGHLVRILVLVTCCLYVVPYVVIQIQAGGLLFESLFVEPLLESMTNFTLGASLLATITTLYILVGGMRSVAWTDVLQGCMLIGGMLMGGLVVVYALGGPRGFSDAIESLPVSHRTAPGTTGVYTPLFLFSVVLFGSTGSMVSPAQWMRYYAASSASTMRRSALVFAIVLTACFLFGVMLVGLGGKALYPEPIDDAGNAFLPDQILLVVLHRQLPELMPHAGVWLASLIIMAIGAASMSTADSNLHALSAVLTRDVFDRYLRPNASPAARTWVGRGVIVVAAVLSLTLVLGGSGPAEAGSFLGRSMAMIADVAFLAIGFSMQLLPATVDILWVRKGTRAGVTAGLLVGLLGTAFVDPAALGIPIRLVTGVWALAANALIFAVVSALDRRRTAG